MKLSIFPKTKALPTKEEKAVEARFTSKPYLPEVVEVATEEDLIEVITNHAWSPSVFKEYRRQDGFISTDFVVLDIDEDMTIEEAEEVVHKLDIFTLCLPSTSHTEEEHRFRLIFPLAKTIVNKDVFEATMRKVAEHFPADPSCIADTARFYFGGKMVDGFLYEADLLEPVAAQKLRNTPRNDFDTRERVTVGESLEELVEELYGEPREKVPESIAYFLENAPDNLAGETYVRCNSFVFTAALSGLDEDRIKNVFYSLYPHEVTDRVEKVVDKIILDGYNEREEEL